MNRGSDFTDFTTLGFDANGVYVSVVYRTSQSNAVLAIDKQQLYASPSALVSWPFPLPVTPGYRTIHPASNYDSPPVGGFAWFVSKAAPDETPGTYRGGSLLYRRLQWSGGVPAWADGDWVTVPEPTPTYRNYFDFDGGDHIGAPQLGGPTRILLSAESAGGVGSRLCMATIRDNELWTCQTVGLDGTDGDYSGDETGTAVDRSALQWIKLPIDSNGALTVADHGRILDTCSPVPLWYYCPSLAVNASGDFVIGFTGSSEQSFINAYYSWRKADGTTPERFGVLKHGLDYYDPTRWGDYSATSVDPVDGSFWTVQEYPLRGDPGIILSPWGTRIGKIQEAQ